MSMWYEDESLLLYIRRFIALSSDKLTSQTLPIAVGEFLYSDEHAERVAAALITNWQLLRMVKKIVEDHSFIKK